MHGLSGIFRFLARSAGTGAAGRRLPTPCAAIAHRERRLRHLATRPFAYPYATENRVNTSVRARRQRSASRQRPGVPADAGSGAAASAERSEEGGAAPEPSGVTGWARRRRSLPCQPLNLRASPCPGTWVTPPAISTIVQDLLFRMPSRSGPSCTRQAPYAHACKSTISPANASPTNAMPPYHMMPPAVRTLLCSATAVGLNSYTSPDRFMPSALRSRS